MYHSAALLACLTSAAAAQQAAVTAFVEATVLPLDSDRTLRGQTVLVSGSRIIAIGPRALVSIPDGARVVECRGKTLLPGLCDAHVHLRHAGEEALLAYLRQGITTVREMNGRPRLLEWRDRIREGRLSGPDLVVACPTIGNWSSPKEGYPTPKTGEEARLAVRAFAEQGYDWIKFYSFLPRNVFFDVVAEARRLGLPAGGHVPIEVTLAEALEAGVTSIEHLTGYVEAAMTAAARDLDEQDMRAVFHAGELDPDRLEAAVTATVASGVWNCPTVRYFDRILPTEMVRRAWSDPELRRLGERNRRAIVQRLHRAGARLVLGTDSDAGDDLAASTIHEEMAAMREAGLPNFAILQSATARAAEFLGLSDEIGTVAVGKRADLILVVGDPRVNLDCLRQPAAVMARGRLVE